MHVPVYDLRCDEERIRAMQRTSLHDGPQGLAADPLIGSEEWWQEVGDGRRPTTVIEGGIARAYWGSMADYPVFEVRGDDGAIHSFTREGDGRRLAPGLRVRVDVVHHPRKTRDVHGRVGEEPQIVIGIWVEDSQARISDIAPGPGGAGLASVRERHGNEVHHLVFPTEATARECAARLGPAAAVHDVPVPGRWYVAYWTRRATRDASPVAELARRAQEHGGRYDGGEEVGGAVWGPAGG